MFSSAWFRAELNRNLLLYFKVLRDNLIRRSYICDSLSDWSSTFETYHESNTVMSWIVSWMIDLVVISFFHIVVFISESILFEIEKKRLSWSRTTFLTWNDRWWYQKLWTKKNSIYIYILWSYDTPEVSLNFNFVICLRDLDYYLSSSTPKWCNSYFSREKKNFPCIFSWIIVHYMTFIFCKFSRGKKKKHSDYHEKM